MDALIPAERVSFVLHDVFEVPFAAIAAILGRSTAATKMLASRSHGGSASAPAERPAPTLRAAREVVDAFLAASRPGRSRRAPDRARPRGRTASAGYAGAVVIRGAGKVAARTRIGTRPDALAHAVVVNGLPGVLITAGGRPVTVVAFTVTDGAVTMIRALTEPGRARSGCPFVGRLT